MGKYTYTASLVDETINILRAADRELSGTNAAVINAVNTILNARGADRLAFDFDDILTLTGFARDDISTVTKEILNKQAEIEAYENAPWWKKLFFSLVMGVLKYIEGHGQAIEYIFDLAVALVGFIGGLFNSEFKASCKEFAEKEHIDNWFTQQFIGENGIFKDVNTYSAFAYNSTAANIIEFGGSLANFGLTLSTTGLITSGYSLYKSIDKLVDESKTKAIVTSTPIIAPKLKEVFEVGEVQDPPSLQEEAPPEDELISDPVPPGGKKKQFKSNDQDYTETVTTPEEITPPLDNPFDPTTGEVNSVPSSTTENSNTMVSDSEIINPNQVLFGKPDEQNNSQSGIVGSHVGTGNTRVNIPKSSSGNEISKKTAGSFSELINGAGTTPVSPKPLSSKENRGTGAISTPLASGVVAAGMAGWGTKTYMDKHNSSDKTETDKDTDVENSEQDDHSLSVDYTNGRVDNVEGDYLTPEDELAFTE